MVDGVGSTSNHPADSVTSSFMLMSNLDEKAALAERRAGIKHEKINSLKFDYNLEVCLATSESN